MKTQLLEDIGQNATLALTPSKPVGNAKAGTQVQKLAPAGNAQPAKPRPALGVWRQKPAEEPLVSMPQQLEEPAPLESDKVFATPHELEEPTPLELDKVFEEIAALEAQLVPPAREHEPAIAPVEPRHEPPAAPAESLHKPAIAPVEPRHASPAPPAEFLHEPAIPPAGTTPAPDPAPRAAAPQDPLFDFTPPSPARQAADPFTPAPTGLTRSGRRYLLWAACLLAGALLIQGGRWLYQERNDAGALALVAGAAKETPRVDMAAKPAAIAAKDATLQPGGDAPVPPAVPARRVSPGGPPLVMLEPEAPASTVEQPPPPVAAQAEPAPAPAPAPKPEPVAQQEPAPPLPKPAARKVREPSRAAAKPAKEKAKREPARQLARAPASAAEKTPDPDTSMAALLRACRAHGYHATQCIKQECSVTKYGFACRGR